jgi:hypothetical protein
MPTTLNRSIYAAPMYLVDAAGEAGSITIQLATNATLAAGASTTPMTVSKTSAASSKTLTAYYAQIGHINK